MLKSTITGAASTSLSAHRKTKGHGFREGDADLHSRLASRDFESLGTDGVPGPQICTSKAEPYKIGERTTDIMLEILNLDKKEAVSINGISNQEFTEELREASANIEPKHQNDVADLINSYKSLYPKWVFDLSLISTPPPERVPIKTHLSAFGKEKVIAAIRYELDCGGQVFCLTSN